MRKTALLGLIPIATLTLAYVTMISYGVALQNWNMVAAIGQAMETAIILVGAPLLLMQMVQAGEEMTHKQWEAVQWALDKLGDEMGNDAGALRNMDYNEVAEILKRWHYVGLAVRHKYLEEDLLFGMVGEHFVGAYPNLFPGNPTVQKIKRDETSEAAFWLTDKAHEWAEKHHPPRNSHETPTSPA